MDRAAKEAKLAFTVGRGRIRDTCDAYPGQDSPRGRQGRNREVAVRQLLEPPTEEKKSRIGFRI